jgi:hypothetical protein
MCMEPVSTRIPARCYKATVNEPETITEAQPFCLVRGRGAISKLRTFGFRLLVAPHIERS